MRALHVPAAGEQPTLSDIADPSPGEGEVLVRVKAAALNPLDNGIAAGMLESMMPHEYPVTLGRDAAGIVEDVGAGVDHVQVGDEVLGHVLLAPPIHDGTLAEYAVLPAATVTAKPSGLDFTTAAAIPLAGSAAAQVVEAVAPQSGQTVLVNGASGGVGSFAVQLLAQRGVSVIATGTSQSADRLRSLGASLVVDYTAGSVAEQVRAEHPDGVDALVNLAGFTAADVPLDAVRKGGRVATLTSAPDQDTLEQAGLTGTNVMARATREVTAPLAEQVANGVLQVQLGSVLPLDRATEGLARIASGGAGGKIVITVAE
jgi:NADPH:quinone reductase-like Zn-dependent oxidoreductase